MILYEPCKLYVIFSHFFFTFTNFDLFLIRFFVRFVSFKHCTQYHLTSYLIHLTSYISHHGNNPCFRSSFNPASMSSIATLPPHILYMYSGVMHPGSMEPDRRNTGTGSGTPGQVPVSLHTIYHTLPYSRQSLQLTQ